MCHVFSHNARVILQEHTISMFSTAYRIEWKHLSLAYWSLIIWLPPFPSPLLPSLCSWQMRHLPFFTWHLLLWFCVLHLPFPLYIWPSKLLPILQGWLKCHIGKHSSSFSQLLWIVRACSLTLTLFIVYLFKSSALHCWSHVLHRSVSLAAISKQRAISDWGMDCCKTQKYRIKIKISWGKVMAGYSLFIDLVSRVCGLRTY